MNQLRDESFVLGSGPLGNSETVQWERLKANGICPNINSLSDYRKEVFEGMERLRETIENHPIATLSSTEVKQFHKTLFGTVHPWAGEFRKVGESVMIAGYPGADSERIGREMDMWSIQTKDMLEKAQTPQEQLMAVAFSHARFERIHPFKDGNGRTGRAITNSQLVAIFGERERSNIDRSQYLEGMKAVGKEGDLTKLVKLLGEREQISIAATRILSPYRIAPFFESNRDLAGDLEASRVN